MGMFLNLSELLVLISRNREKDADPSEFWGGVGWGKWTTQGSEPLPALSLGEGEEEGGRSTASAFTQPPSTPLTGQMRESETITPVSESVADKDTRLGPVHPHTCLPVCAHTDAQTYTHTGAEQPESGPP